MIKTEPQWYALYTASRAEKKVEERLKEAGVEHYLPMQTVVRVWSDRKKRVDVPVINGYIFARFQLKDLGQILNIAGVSAVLKEEGHPAVIPEKQMQALRFMIEHAEEKVEFSAFTLTPGVSIRIVRGQLEGMVGELVQIKGKYKVAIRLENFGCALTTVAVSSIEKI